MSALLRHVGVVSQSDSVSLAQTAKVSAALQIQVSRDFSPIWDVSATVAAFERLDDLPVGFWPLMIVDDVKDAAGIHLDDDGEPYALAEAGEQWSLTASHELLEMLVDPLGNRLNNGLLKTDPTKSVRYLVEVCDPCEDAALAYEINGFKMSDFYTPQFFDANASTAARYSFRGNLSAPLQVLRGGYLSWMDPANGHWWQEAWFDTTPVVRDLGVLASTAGNVRWSLKQDIRREQASVLRGRARTSEEKERSLLMAAQARPVAPSGHQSRRAQMLQAAAQRVINAA